jgi:2,4-dienoyl-CoA reductase-like NADH-dependent reductase (Old Yellow Enzyme family)/thioredoxin reductase
MKSYPNLFTPVTIRGITLRNKIISTPNQTRFQNNIEAAYMESKARGGAAAVVLGECPVNEFRCRQAYHYTFLPNNIYNLRFMSETATTIKQHGAVAGLQLYHPGHYALPHRGEASLPPIGPMGFMREDGIEVIAMDDDLIEETIEDYANAAVRAVRAGFEWIHVHSGHGWLLCQFLSPRTNRRTDKYGGSLENRVRFPIEIFRRIREKAGWDFVLEMRVSGDEMLPGGMPIEEVAEYVKMVEDYVDVANISVGVHEAFDTVYRQFAHSGFTPHGVNRGLSKIVKDRGTKVLISAVGGISSPELAEEILENGEADLIGMARALLADPDFPNKARAGKADEIIPCLRCNNCVLNVGVQDIIRCAVNAQTGDELHWQLAPKPESSRKVAVVGGGPAGMRAALTAMERGHDVTLFEKGDKLGGILNIADYGDLLKEDMKIYKDFLVRQTQKKVNVKLNTPGTKDNVSAIAPDAVIVAVGAHPIIPEIPGIEGAHILTGIDAYEKSEEAGENVVVIGGGLVGCEAGLFLAEKGRKVTIVEKRKELGDLVDWRQTLPLLTLLKDNKNITTYTDVRIDRIASGAVTIVDEDGKETDIKADTIVVSIGLVPDKATGKELGDVAPWFREIGDCHKSGRILAATRDAYWAAMDIL